MDKFEHDFSICYARLNLLYCTYYAIDCIDDPLFCKNLTSYYFTKEVRKMYRYITTIFIKFKFMLSSMMFRLEKTKQNSHDNKCCQKSICSRNFCFCYPHFLLLKGFSAWKDHKIVWSRVFFWKSFTLVKRGKGRIPQVLIYVETGMRWTLMLLLLFIRLNE